MKVSAFLLGGLAGAAAVIFIQRNKRMVSAVGNIGWSQVKSRVNGMKDEAIGKMWSKSFESHDSAGGLDKVAHLAAQDSEVQRRVNEILEESGQNQI
ncbi:hypothetical protein COLU111180_07925 [Cohnella lubricantis]|uniref:Uncharacterized protein n=1 Tax=Cohnella lubricantis TaxID=2163172 RepID=A0A841TFJ3_9BACL|nr:hypothetical protein [Cohnella lubricantis]MBB6677717.1 hypothetical protein [Cohnella lubricantis]MBP2117679.1 hypothetical protein [Cohnella lubricantis]